LEDFLRWVRIPVHGRNRMAKETSNWYCRPGKKLYSKKKTHWPCPFVKARNPGLSDKGTLPVKVVGRCLFLGLVAEAPFAILPGYFLQSQDPRAVLTLFPGDRPTRRAELFRTKKIHRKKTQESQRLCEKIGMKKDGVGKPGILLGTVIDSGPA